MSDGTLNYIYFNSHIHPASVGSLLREVYGAWRKQPNTPICLLIHCEGGNIIHAIHAYEMLRAIPVELTTWNVGWVASAAILLYVSGVRRIAAPHSSFVFHNVIAGTTDAQDAAAVAANGSAVDPTRLRQADIIHERTGFCETSPIGDELVWRDPTWGVDNGFVHCVKHLDIPLGSMVKFSTRDYLADPRQIQKANIIGVHDK